MEVFLFLTMGGTVGQIEVLPIEPQEKSKIAACIEPENKAKKIKEFTRKMFEKIDVGACRTKHENERHLLLGVIEEGTHQNRH